MVIIERLIQQVKPDGWTALDTLDARFNTVEQRLGSRPSGDSATTPAGTTPTR